MIRDHISSILEAASEAAAEIERTGEAELADPVLAQMSAVDRELGRARRNVKKEAGALRAAVEVAKAAAQPAPADEEQPELVDEGTPDAVDEEEPAPRTRWSRLRKGRREEQPAAAALVIRDHISSILEAASEAAAEIERTGEAESADPVLAQMSAVDRELGRARRNVKKEATALRAAVEVAKAAAQPAPADEEQPELVDGEQANAADEEEPAPRKRWSWLRRKKGRQPPADAAEEVEPAAAAAVEEEPAAAAVEEEPAAAAVEEEPAAADEEDPTAADDSDAPAEEEAPAKLVVPEGVTEDELTASVRQKSDDELAESFEIALHAQRRADKASDEKMTVYWRALHDAAVTEASGRPEFGEREPDPALGRRERKQRAKRIRALVEASEAREASTDPGTAEV